MNTIEDEKTVQEAKERRDFLQTRLQVLQADSERLRQQTEQGQEKIMLAFVEGEDPAKARTSLMADREQLKLTLEAVAVCKRQLAEVSEIADREATLKYRKQKSDFFRHLIAFIDKDFSAFMKSYYALEAEFSTMMSGAGWGSPEYPYIEKQVFDLFFGVLNKNALPHDLASVQKRLATYFETARKAK